MYDLHAVCFRQHAGHLVKLGRCWYAVRSLAETDLTQRADVAEFTDPVMPVVVRHTMCIRHGA
jgi:hypothetical protein